MIRKSVLLAIAILVIAVGLVFSLQEKQAKVPPGVSPSLWVPLTENSGIALNGTESYVHGRQLFRGTLMVNAGGRWQRIYIESWPGGLVPLDK